MKKVNKIVAIVLGFTLMLPGFAQIASAAEDTKEYIAVTDQVLRWRDSDQASSNGFISEGQKVQFVEEKGTDWFKVKAGEKEGYVRRGELTSVKNYNDTEEAAIHETPMKDKEALDELVVTIDVSLRTKDESKYRPITLLKRESAVTYEGTTQKDWFKVDYKGQKGYVYRGDVTSKKNWEDQDKTIHETAMAGKEDFGKLEVLFDVNLRTKDENQYRPITLLAKGDIVHYQGTTKKGWFKVKNEAGDEGYVYRGNVTKYEDLELTKDTVLEKDEAFVNLTKDKAVIDLNEHKVGTLTVTANDTVIKNGEVKNIIIGKDVENVTLEDIIDDGEGNHDFAGGGAKSIILKGNTNLKSNIQITSSTPIQIRSVDLKEGKGMTGKVTVDTESAVTIAAPVKELEVKKANEDIQIKADVEKVVALANVTIKMSENVKTPKLEKAKGIKASATDSTGKEEVFEENEALEPTTPVEPEPEPEEPTPTPTPTPDPTPTPTPDSVISTNEIKGIVPPARDGIPSTANIDTTQYTGTVEWNLQDDEATFKPNKVYTATINLTAKSGYTLKGVKENFFTVDGATRTTNIADSGVVRAEFPKTSFDKVKFTIQSPVEDGQEVSAAVDSNYIAQFIIPNGMQVNAGGAKLKLEMTDIDGLGVVGTKSHEMVINTGLTETVDISLEDYIKDLLALKDSELNVNFGGKQDTTVKYALKKDQDNNNHMWLMIPDNIDNARAGWQYLANDQVLKLVHDKEDSNRQISIPKGAYLRIGNQKLEFKNDLKLDNIDNSLTGIEDKIRDAVELSGPEDSNGPVDSYQEEIEFRIPVGTTLQIGKSEAKLKETIIVDMDGFNIDKSILNEILKNAQKSEGAEDIIKESLKILNTIAKGMQDKTINININKETASQ